MDNYETNLIDKYRRFKVRKTVYDHQPFNLSLDDFNEFITQNNLIQFVTDKPRLTMKIYRIDDGLPWQLGNMEYRPRVRSKQPKPRRSAAPQKVIAPKVCKPEPTSPDCVVLTPSEWLAEIRVLGGRQ